MASPAIRFCIALNAAALLSILAFGLVPQDLDVRTDIVGYPTYANFNVNRYFWAYGFAVGLFPALTLGIYLALTRVFGRRQAAREPIPPPVDRVETVPPARGRTTVFVAAGRALLVGGVLGLEAVIISALADDKVQFALVTLGYATAVAVAAWALARATRRDLLGLVSTVNTAAAPLTLLLLYGVSESTQVTVIATGVVHVYPWLPLWLAAAVVAGVWAWLVRALLRANTPAERSLLERRAVLLVVAPIGLFLLVASLPGDLGTINLFEEGQILAGAEITRDGAFPWRDLLVVHGLLYDVGTGLFGSAVIEDSRWAVVAGDSLLIVPLSWVALYYLCVYLFGANWLFLLGSQLLVVTSQIFAIHTRLGLIPIVLLLLAALLHRPTVARAIAFTTLLFFQAIVTPEALWAIPAYLGVIFLFELYYRDRGSGLARNLRRTWLCAASAGVLMLGWSVFLWANEALDDFIFSYRAFIPGHQLTGGVPLGTYGAVLRPSANIGEHYEEFGILAPVVLVLFAILFFVVRTRTRRTLAVSDWVVLAAVAFVLPYYAKFLSRSDHVYHSFAMAVPPLLYLVYRSITFAETGLARLAKTRGARWFPARHVLTLPLLLALLVSAPVALQDAVRAVPPHFAVDVAEEPELALLGYARQGENDIEMFEEVGRALDSLLEPGEAVFDFSNTPGLFHYLLDRPAPNRYYHVGIAIRQRTQTDLIQLLERDRPKVVVFTSWGIGGSASVWDKLSNQVRSYDVSEYLLDHYVPVRELHSFVLMRRREDGVPAQRELYFRVPPCDWGYVPNFFSPAPASDARAQIVPFRKLDPVLRIRGWAVDEKAVRPAPEVVVTREGKVIARTRPTQSRPDVSFQFGVPAYRDSGFAIVVPVRNASDDDFSKIRVQAIMKSGDAKELSLEPHVAAEQTDALNLVDRRGAPASKPIGAIDAADISQPLALTLPDDARTYRWFEVRTGGPLRNGSFELSDRLEEIPLGARMISFRTLDRGEHVARLRVGACSQWRGYKPSELILTPTPDQDIREIRLLR